MIGFIVSRFSSRATADTPTDKVLNAGGTQMILQEPRSRPCLVLRQRSRVIRRAV